MEKNGAVSSNTPRACCGGRCRAMSRDNVKTGSDSAAVTYPSSQAEADAMVGDGIEKKATDAVADAMKSKQ